MADAEDVEVSSYREQAFLAYCQERGLVPSRELRDVHRAGCRCGVEYLRIKLVPLIEVALKLNSRGRGRVSQEEAPSLFNLWGSLP